MCVENTTLCNCSHFEIRDSDTLVHPLSVCFPLWLICACDCYLQDHPLVFQGLMRHNSNKYKLRDLLPREDEWEIPSDSLVREAQLGEGCFGEVYKGFVRGPIETSRTLKNAIHTTVAIKYLKCKNNQQHICTSTSFISVSRNVLWKCGNRILLCIDDMYVFLYFSQSKLRWAERLCEWDRHDEESSHGK